MAVDTSYLGRSNPGINEQLLTAQQQLALAQALRGQALQPTQVPGGQNGRISPLSVLAQALSGGLSGKMMGGATHDLATAQAAQAQNQWNMMRQASNEMTDAAAGAPPGAVPPPAAPAQAAPQGPTPEAGQPPTALPGAGISPAALASTLQGGAAPAPDAAPPAGVSPTALAGALQGSGAQPDPRRLISAANLNSMMGNEAAAKFGFDTAGQVFGRNMDRATPAPTDTEKMLLSQGVPRGSPAWNQALQGAVMKANYIAPVQVGQGNVALNPTTNQPILQNPKMADGVTADFTNPMAPTASAMPGYASANAGIVGAAEKAKADQQIRDVTLPTGAVVPVRAGAAANAGGAQAGLGPATWTGNQLPPDQVNRLRAAAQSGDPQSQQLIDAYDKAQPRLGADPTVQAARTGQQTALAEKWKPLNDAAANTQTVNARLDTIADLAGRASVGPMSDKVQYANSLLSMAGSDKATDATSAKALLDKNANQIVAQLGQGGMGTDAARAILGAAYPNSKMPAPAIKEAVSNLKAVNTMTEAKARVLQPHYLNNDPAAYQQAESQFNAVADPRVFQWYGMHDPSQQAAYAKRMIQQDPTFRSKVEALTKMGALK